MKNKKEIISINGDIGDAVASIVVLAQELSNCPASTQFLLDQSARIYSKMLDRINE